MDAAKEPEPFVQAASAKEFLSTTKSKLTKNVALDEIVHHRLELFKVYKKCKTFNEALDLLLKLQGVA